MVKPTFSRFQRIHLFIHIFFIVLFLGMLVSRYNYNTAVYSDGHSGIGIGLVVFAGQFFRLLQIILAIIFVVSAVVKKSFKSKSFYLVLIIFLFGQILGYFVVN